MRTFHRSVPEYATGLFTETTGADISACAVDLGLSPDKDTPPSSWLEPTVLERPTPSTARASLLIDSSVPVGTYVLWVRVTDAPEQLARPAKNELIRVV